MLTTTTHMKNNGKNMKILITVVSLFTALACNAKIISQVDNNNPIIVAVIDTGFDFNSTWKEQLSLYDRDGYRLRKPKTCKYGHTDFTGKGIKDNHGHGTHVAGVLAKFAEDVNYCLVILKYYDNEKENVDHMVPTLKALQKAIDLKVSIINYSGGGTGKSDVECNLIKRALDIGIVVVVAAGNENSNINKKPYYPAMCDSRVIAVSNTDDMGNIASNSNFTDKKRGSRELVSEKGLNVLSLLPNNKSGMMTGTSQATPTYTGKLIKKMKTK